MAWARHQLAQGRQVWSTPSIHTWDAWLTQRWREAALRGEVAPLQLLNTGQERALWESVLARLAAPGDDETSLTLHAGALMQSAARAVQAQLPLERTTQSREESLLVAALAEVRRECAARGVTSLRLAPAGALGFLRHVPAPLVVGEPRLTALQSSLARQCWPEAMLLAPEPPARTTHIDLKRAADLEQELAACARWCRAHVERDPGARLLVLSACIEPSLAIQAKLLWRFLAGAGSADDTLRARWLAVEGGEPLLHQALVSDALLALELASGQAEVQTQSVLALLRSPYFAWGTEADAASLGRWFADLGLGRWERAALLEALGEAARHEPAAARLAQWLAEAAEQLPLQKQATTQWAGRFTTVLQQAAFAAPAILDSRDIQRLGRWHELLDEFAGLDAVLPAMTGQSALARLRTLAAQARHQPATGDAAVTLSGVLADPVAGYDAIWVLGLSEQRWPSPARPDSWVALAEQRRAGWPESGAGERRAQALWALSRWQARTGELVLSYAEREGDVTHRPARLVGPGTWLPVDAAREEPPVGLSTAAEDLQLAPINTAGDVALPGGSGRLAAQQACPFRAQAQCRLGAGSHPLWSAGVPPSLRGRLLHLLLQQFWIEVKGQAGLLALAPAAERELLERSWSAAVAATRAARWLAPQVRERERLRTLDLVARVLQLERARAPFTVQACELPVTWSAGSARLTLRIDRIDEVEGNAVLLDYKSGAAARVALHEGELQPLQLALYAAALAQQGRDLGAVALLNLRPHDPDIAGVSAREGLLPRGTRAIEDWPAAQQQWQQALLGLMRAHLSGDATLTRDPGACARCHLPALCRRAGADIATGDAAGEAGALAGP